MAVVEEVAGYDHGGKCGDGKNSKILARLGVGVAVGGGSRWLGVGAEDAEHSSLRM